MSNHLQCSTPQNSKLEVFQADHLHFHIVPRYGKEEITFESHSGDMNELKSLAERLRIDSV
jgi:diadenosine tetraphosphate (Ap4A) HIT family hydrolase